MGSNLATRLREETKNAHSMIENIGFVKCFLKGVVEKNSYRKLVSTLYFVYSEMEEQMRSHQDHLILSRIYFPLLNRHSSLAQDLNFFYGVEWQKLVVASPAAKAYVKRIQEVSSTEPELLIAHVYTRYMGDLSGGQILKGIAQRSLNLSAGKGLSFFEFRDIKDTKQFKAMYRQRLNELSLSKTMADRIVDEANTAFKMNMKVFQELDGSLIKAIGQVVFNRLTLRRNRGRTVVHQ